MVAGDEPKGPDGLGFWVLGFRDSELGCRVLDLGHSVGFRVWACRVWGLV